MGPDGCFYVTQSDKVVKLAPCFFQTPTADLSVTTTAPSSVGILEPFSYSFVVTNAGPSQATGASFTDTLGPAVSFASATPGQGSCNQAGGVVTCSLGNIAPGDSVTVTVAVSAGLLPGSAVNTASVTSTVPDPNPADDSSTATTVVGLLPVPVAPTPTPTTSPSVLPFNIVRPIPVTGPGYPVGRSGCSACASSRRAWSSSVGHGARGKAPDQGPQGFDVCLGGAQVADRRVQGRPAPDLRRAEERLACGIDGLRD